MTKVNIGGRVSMLVSFDSMRELLITLNDVIPNNAFLRKWLKSRLSKKEGEARMRRSRQRGKRGREGYRGQSGRVANKNLRYCETNMDRTLVDEFEELIANSKVSKDVLLMNHVVHVT